MSNIVTKAPCLCCRIIRNIIPWRFRRLVFLSAVYSSVTNKRAFDRSHIQRLNKVLNLSNGFHLPNLRILMASSRWIHEGEKEFFIDNQLLTLADLGKGQLDEAMEDVLIGKIVCNMPSVMRYAKTPQAVYDVKRLLRELRFMDAVPTPA